MKFHHILELMSKFPIILVFFLSANLCLGQSFWEYAKVPYQFVTFKIPVDSKFDSLDFGDSHFYSWEYSDFSFSFDVFPWTNLDDTILSQNIDSLEAWKFENTLSLLRDRNKIKISGCMQIGKVKLYHISYKTFFRKSIFFIRKQGGITSILLFINGNFKYRFAISCKKSSKEFRKFHDIEKRFIESLEFR